MNQMVVFVHVPAVQQDFEMKIPAALNCRVAASLTSRAIEPLTAQDYLASRSSLFAWRDTGNLLSLDKSMEEAGVKNGSQLLLV